MTYALSWTPFAVVVTVAAWPWLRRGWTVLRDLIEWDGDDGVGALAPGQSLLPTLRQAMGVCAFVGAAGVVGVGFHGTKGAPPTSYDPPTTPTVDAVVPDTNSVRIVTSAFNADPGDTHATSSFKVGRYSGGASTCAGLTAIGGLTVTNSADSLTAYTFTNADSIKADTVYTVCALHTATNGGASAWSDTTAVTIELAWFEESWDFADSAAMHAASYLAVGPGGDEAQLDLVIDSSAPWGAPYKHMRAYQTSSSGSNGYDITLPDASTDQPVEIWQEMYVKFGPGWKTDWGKAGNPDHKTYQWYDQNETGSTRWGLKFGVFGGSTQASSAASFIGIDDSCSSVTYSASSIWTNTWRKIRVHLAITATPDASSQEGTFRLSIDDVTEINCTIADVTAHNAGNYFNKAVLGRNLNQLPDSTIWVDHGRVQIFITDPGWTW